MSRMCFSIHCTGPYKFKFKAEHGGSDIRPHLQEYAEAAQFRVVVLIGDAAVGKTCILSRYVKGVVPKQKSPTIGVEFATKVVQLKDNVNVKAQLWDTAGTEKYRAMTAAYSFLSKH